MPIKGLSEIRRMPRLGKIHLGIKKRNDKGIEYPAAVEYFVCPPEVQAVFGKKPKELRIMIPVEDPEKWASQYYRYYSRTRGIVCRGDGNTATRWIDIDTGALANHESKNVLQAKVSCGGRECEEYNKRCKEVMNLQFLLVEVPGLGIWQLDTGSINSIININSAAELVRSVYGRVSMIPLLLTVEPQEVKTAEGIKKTINVLNFRTRDTLRDLILKAEKPLQAEPELPVPDDEIPELILPQNQEPPEDIERGNEEDESPPMTTVGDLLNACYKTWGLTRTAVLKALGISDTKTLNSPKALLNAFHQIQAIREGK